MRPLGAFNLGLYSYAGRHFEYWGSSIEVTFQNENSTEQSTAMVKGNGSRPDLPGRYGNLYSGDH